MAGTPPRGMGPLSTETRRWEREIRGILIVAETREYFGPYHVVRLLNSGQSCQVWEAVHSASGNRVAIKSVHPSKQNDSATAEALKLEYDIGKVVKHPNVVELYEFQQDRMGTYLVMELFSSRNLKQLLREGFGKIAWLSPKIVVQAAEGLACLHSHGWVHRDIKPDNYLVTPEGGIKLIDFSIAIKMKTGLGLSLAKLMGGRGKVQGTRSYMAPEQIRGEPVDPRADLYSLACMIFELVGGKLPFSAVNPDDLLNKHLHSPPVSLAIVNDNVTSEFAGLVAKCLAKKKEQRPDSVDEFLRDLRAIKIYRMRPKPPESEVATG